nr:NADH dehydrogenase subunit 11a [Navicula sp.]
MIKINNTDQIKNIDNKLTLINYLINKGITIPYFCYHNGLSIAGNCRTCLVELENSPKPVVSCGINAKSCLMNNKVYYDSVLLKKARENILEFLLLNHPVDCPICDQGGECDLQEQSLFFGFTKKRFYKFKRVVTDKDLGPIVKTVMTRCIHCTRCVRFASEIAGIEDLGVFSRGAGSEIGTYVDKIFLSELSGNVIDLCPVGSFSTLMPKSYKKLARGFYSTQVKSDHRNTKTFKNILFDMFLKYQFTVCTEPKIPFSHCIPLSLLTCIFNSFYYIGLYGLSILYILLTLYLSQKFSDSFGSWYLNFLKSHSSTEAFNKYCGNPCSALKVAVKNPEFVKTIFKNGGGKVVAGTGVALVTEHTMHQLKFGQIYDYKMDQYMNGGKHSSGQPFSLKHNGPSLLKSLFQKKTGFTN